MKNLHTETLLLVDNLQTRWIYSLMCKKLYCKKLIYGLGDV